MTTKLGELGEANSKPYISAKEEGLGLDFGLKYAPPRDTVSISEDCLSAAEVSAEQVLNCVHPTLDSEEKRRDVIDCVQQLIKNRVNCEVVSYGSVPLKTYLPDGDIDLTVIRSPKADESLVHDILSLLQDEERRNENAEYEVKDTQFIDAEVKLVKCLVRNIVIDISFNQLGGLSTLCFLEQVDRFVGRNHLFKRSIILVKAWCFYESRILGAHHGLLSTYALEALILYIFQLFHSSLKGPLAVLHRFLDYYSQFDWENYCISLEGPVCKSSLPEIVVKMPESRWRKLLSEEFLENCSEMFSVPSRGIDTPPKIFQTKHLNIIDPLKENNNLGRSVHRGNFYRIRSALKFGARRLVDILLQPKDKVADEIKKFFANTCARHGNVYQCSDRHLIPAMDDEESWTASLSTPVEAYSEDYFPLKSPISDFRDTVCVKKNELDRYSSGGVSSETASDARHFVNGDKDGIETSNSILRNAPSDYISSSNHYSASVSENHCHKSQSLLRSSAENGSMEAGQVDSTCMSFSSWLKNGDKHTKMTDTYKWCMESSELTCNNGSCSTLKPNILKNLSLDSREFETMSIGGESDLFNPLADLTGDYDSHVRNLLHGYSLSAPVVCNSPSPQSRIENKKPWDIIRESMPLNKNMLSQMISNTVSVEHTVYSGSVPTFFVPAFPQPKARGTGTYFPQPNILYPEKSSFGNCQSKVVENSVHLQRNGHSNGSSSDTASGESNSLENQPVRSRCCPEPRKLVHSRSMEGQNEMNRYSNAICRIEFGSIGNLEELISGTTVGASLKTQATIPQRVGAGQSVCLTNDADFPPLCQ